MKELTVVLYTFGHKELKDYLKSLKGIIDVKIKNEDDLEIYIQYDSNLISYKIIKMEIYLFLNILKLPSLISFDKHSKEKLNKYKIEIKDLCCEFCFRGAIENLFEIDGIEKVNSNFEADEYRDEIIIININYDKNLLSIDDLQKIEKALNL